MRKQKLPFASMWETDRGLEVLLLLLVLFIFAGRPLLAIAPEADLAIEILFSLILVSGVAATARGTTSSVVVTIFAVLNIIAGWSSWGTRLVWVREVHSGLSFAYCVLLAGIVLRRVTGRGEVTRHRIEGAVAAYLLLGLAWTFAYLLCNALLPGAFSGAVLSGSDGEDAFGRFLYFSFVTLTTVGYGDIAPAVPTTQMLAVSEALIGQLFPAILLARLVSMELHYRLIREQRRLAAEAEPSER